MTPDERRVAYDFVVLRLVPHVHRYTSIDVGVVLHARTEDYLDARVIDDRERLLSIAPGVDAGRVVDYLNSLAAVARGEESGGRLALLPPSERFHWLTAPRSDLLQCSPIHGGLTDDPASTLRALFEDYVGA